ncbi:MAG: type II toxin-antitoxin system HicA family toxin [Verrucomicrobia bacterium]|nr:type II toxin-antitoxin system HicA family toxin [Verrucomicrobiota bacterium]
MRFADFVRLVEAFGFRRRRITGSHHLFARPGVPQHVNLQNVRGPTKPYQVDQFLKLIEVRGLNLEDK